MNQNLIIWIFFKKNIISGIQRFYFCADVSVDIVRVFFNFRFSSRKSQSQQKVAKKITFYNTVSFKNLTHFTNLRSLDIENNMLPLQSQKPFWLYKSSIKHVSVLCQKIILIEIFENSTVFQHFDTFIYCIKMLKFSRQFGL